MQRITVLRVLSFSFFLHYMKAIDEEICPSEFRNCYIHFKTAMIVFVSLRPTKSQMNFKKSLKISNIFLKGR